MDKKQLREIAKRTRSGIVAGNKPQQIANNFFAAIQANNKIVAVYSPIKGEVDIEPITEKLKNICLPVINGQELEFRAWNKGEELVKNKFGIPEPKANTKCQKPDIIIIPCLAFNKEKYRLGYGGGFYDRTLPKLDALKIGVAYADQQMDFIPELHDVKLDLIITEKMIIGHSGLLL